MNMRKKLREFFTMTRRAEEGFTLVELIVVIAIVAILGGVAVPAYSGYIEKADRAADAQLLADVNKAFAAACMVKGIDNYNNENVPNTLTIGEDRKLPDIDITGVEQFNETFKTFYEGGEFKKTTQLEYNAAKGRFEDPDAGETVTITIGGFPIKVSKELADALKNTTFSEITANTLMGKVDSVAKIAASIFGPEFQNSVISKLIYGNDEGQTYLNNLAASLKMDPSSEEFLRLVYDDDVNLKGSVLANSLVLTAAQKTQGMDTSFLGQTGSTDKLKAELDNPATATDAMAKLAMTYGMYTSYCKYANKTDASDSILASGSLTGMAEVLRSVESEEFREYLASPTGQKDMNAYKASMQIVNDSSSQSTDAAKDILNNGFSDPDLVAALDGLMK